MLLSPTKARRLSGRLTAIERPADSIGPMLLLLGASTLLAIWSLLNVLTKSSSEPSFTPIAIATVAWFSVYILTTFSYFRSPYLFATAYLVVLAIFHLGLVAQEGIGLIPGPLFSGDFRRWVVLASYYSLLSIGMIGIGFCTANMRHQKRKRASRELSPEQRLMLYQRNMRRLWSLGVGLAWASMALLFLAVIQLGNLLEYSRFELFYLARDTRSIGVFSMIGPSSAIALAVAAMTPRQRRIGYTYAFFIFAIFLLSGYRTAALFPFLTFAICWIKAGRRIPATLAISTVVAITLIIPVIGYLRSVGSYEDFSLKAFQEAREYASAKESIAGLGRTIGILAHTLIIVPAEEDYRWGGTYWLYAKRSIPNIGGVIDTSDSRSASSRYATTNESLANMIPSDWATFHILPEQFRMGGGVGFTGVGEPYLNFGLTGVLVFFFATGYFLGWLDRQPIYLRARLLTFNSIFFWHFLVTTRNDFGVFLKPAIFTLIILLIWLAARKMMPFLDIK